MKSRTQEGSAGVAAIPAGRSAGGWGLWDPKDLDSSPECACSWDSQLIPGPSRCQHRVAAGCEAGAPRGPQPQGCCREEAATRPRAVLGTGARISYGTGS